MIRDAIDKVLQLAAPNTLELDGLTFTDKPLRPIEAPMGAAWGVSTLTGFITSLESIPFDPNEWMVRVDSLTSVSAVSRSRDKWGRIATLAHAQLDKDLRQFSFDQFMDHEKFVIGLLSQFAPNYGDDLASVVELASKIAEDANVETTDDGFGQRTTVRNGIALKAERTIKSRVALTPYRTFREVVQPVSDFVFRVKPGAMCALFEADGGAWRINAAFNIASWLKNALAGSPVERLNSLPVVF